MSFINQQGFAVLTSTVLLSLAGIIFTANMTKIQLLDNQVISNYYRNKEAFNHAESGINLVLSKLDKSSDIVASLPSIYQPTGHYYRVSVDPLDANTLQITSLGKSKDGGAQLTIQLQVHYDISYHIPDTALASNGKLNIDAMANINEGCEGAASCHSQDNRAKYQLISNPVNETIATTCTGETLGENHIHPQALMSSNMDYLSIGEQVSVTDELGDVQTETTNWPSSDLNEASFYGNEINPNQSPTTLFESTFGVTKTVATSLMANAVNVVTIDMRLSTASSCSQSLNRITDDITTIYIKGDCDIDSHHLQSSEHHEHHYFSIGSADHPKLIFIEGGQFIAPTNSGVSVTGMLYFLPGKESLVDQYGTQVQDNQGNALLIEKPSINLAGVHVNGAMLSDYDCSYSQPTTQQQAPSFSTRYDKSVLNQLYKNRGSTEVDFSYTVINGTWRDF